LKLHLHLGAHKTATTHFQNVLEANRHLYHDGITYVAMEEFRNNMRRTKNGIDFGSSGPYLNKIKALSQTLVISEENLSGETKDIYKELFLYSSMEDRLNDFKRFTQDFEKVEIWFSVRSMDGFLPSIYCEALRHFPYKSFNEVYGMNYSQIWLPVIQSICRAFPNSKVNVISHENYTSVLPEVIKQIFGENENWNYLDDVRPRAAMNHYACKLMGLGVGCLPTKFSSGLTQVISNMLDKNNIGYKFAPFNKKEVDGFLRIYEKDLKAIELIEQVVVY